MPAPPITQQQLDAARTNQPVRELVNEITAPYNPGQIRRTQQTGSLPDEQAVKRAIQARQEDILRAAEKQVIADFNGLADTLIKDISKPASGASSAVGGGTSDKLRLTKLAEDAALEKQGKESAAAREIANRDLNERRIKQNFLNETVGPQGVRVPLSQVGAVTKAESQKEFERAEELANAQIREESLAKLRANAQGDFNSFFKEVQPGVRSLNKKFNTNQLANEEKRVAQLRELGQSAALGALQGQGALSVGGSLLGSLVGSAAPGGAAFGGLVGGALGASAERTIESITRALEKAAEAGLSFETSILGISSVLQATTRVSGPGGEALGLGDQLSFQQGQARSIQKLARTKLLPLGISGDKESTLVQSIISGAAQRGIQLTPEQAATLAERLGGAIQSQRPELLGNSGQLRRDVEDLFSGAPQNTVLKTLTKGFAPGLGKATSAEDLIKRSEGLASFPETLRSSTTNPVVAAQKLNSAVDNLNTTVGDALVTALIPGINALAKELANPQLLDGVEKMGAAIGGVASFFATASAGLIGLTTDAVRLVTSIPGAAGGLVGVAARRAIGRGSSAENDLLELQEKKRGGFFTDQREIDAQITAAQKKFDQENIKNKVTPKASVELAKALRGSGIDDLNTSASPDLKSGAAILASLEEASKQIRKETLEGIQDAEANNKDPKNLFSKIDVGARIKDLLSNEVTQRLGLSFEKVSALRKDSADRQSTFDTSSSLGQLYKSAADLEDKSAIRTELENTVKLAKTKREELKKDALPEDIKKANESVRASTLELIKARNDEREAVDKLKDSEISRAKALRDSQFDPRTFQGQSGLIQSGIQDATARINKADAELDELRKALRATKDPTETKNLESRLEKAALQYNSGQIDRSSLSAQAQNNVIGLAEGSFSAEKALFDFKQANEVAAEKLLSFADKIAGLDSQSAALTDQIAKSKRNLEDFDASKHLRDLGREGNIIDAAERAYKSSGGNFGAQNSISSKIPRELRSLVKGDFFFSQFDRDQFEVDKSLTGLDDTLSKNSPGRFATEERETRSGILRSIEDEERSRREIERAKKAAQREKDAAPFEDTNRRFALLKNLVGLNQQGVNIGADGQKAILEQSKALGINLPGLQKAETLNAEVPVNVSSINETVKQILQLMSGMNGGFIGSVNGGVPGRDVIGSYSGGALGTASGGAVGVGNLTTSGGRPVINVPMDRDKDLLKLLTANGVKVKTDDFAPKGKYGDPNGKVGEFNESEVAGLYTRFNNQISVFSTQKGHKKFDPRKEEDDTLDHESLHALDNLLGRPSDSKEFKKLYDEAVKGFKKGDKLDYGYQNTHEFFAELGEGLLNHTENLKETSPGSLDPAKAFIAKILNTPDFGVGSAKNSFNVGTSKLVGGVRDLFDSAPLFEDGPEELKQITSGINDNPINFSDLTAPRANLSSNAYNPLLREGLNGAKGNAKGNAVLEDVVGGFLDADVDGLKKQNRAPASGLKNGLFSGGLFGDREDVKSGKGTAESNFADSVGAKIDENFNKLGDIISKALGGAL